MSHRDSEAAETEDCPSRAGGASTGRVLVGTSAASDEVAGAIGGASGSDIGGTAATRGCFCFGRRCCRVTGGFDRGTGGGTARDWAGRLAGGRGGM